MQTARGPALHHFPPAARYFAIASRRSLSSPQPKKQAFSRRACRASAPTTPITNTCASRPVHGNERRLQHGRPEIERNKKMKQATIMVKQDDGSFTELDEVGGPRILLELLEGPRAGDRDHVRGRDHPGEGDLRARGAVGHRDRVDRGEEGLREGTRARSCEGPHPHRRGERPVRLGVFRDGELVAVAELSCGRADDRAEVRRLVDWFHKKLHAEVTRDLLGEKLYYRLRPELAARPPSGAQTSRPATACSSSSCPTAAPLPSCRTWWPGATACPGRTRCASPMAQAAVSRRRSAATPARPRSPHR